MPTEQYMLTRQQKKPCTHLGIETIEKPGNQPNVKMQRYIPFTPGKITEVDASWDMSAAVDAGFVVKVNAKKYAKPAGNAPVAPKDEDPKDEPKDDEEPASEPEEPEPEEPEPEEPEPEEPEPEEDEEGEPKGDDRYTELDDGRFQCLVCLDEGEEKILKTEKGMIGHVEDKHN